MTPFEYGYANDVLGQPKVSDATAKLIAGLLADGRERDAADVAPAAAA